MKIILLNGDMSHPDLDHQSDSLFSQIPLYLIKCLLQLELRGHAQRTIKMSRTLSQSVTAWTDYIIFLHYVKACLNIWWKCV